MISYEEKLGLPKNKITNFAKFVTRKLEAAHLSGVGLKYKICKLLKATLSNLSIDDLITYLYFLDWYELPANKELLEDWFETDINYAVKQNRINYNSVKNIYSLSPNSKKFYDNMSKGFSLEDNSLLQKYSEVLNFYGQEYSWEEYNPMNLENLANLDFNQVMTIMLNFEYTYSILLRPDKIFNKNTIDYLN